MKKMNKVKEVKTKEVKPKKPKNNEKNKTKSEKNTINENIQIQVELPAKVPMPKIKHKMLTKQGYAILKSKLTEEKYKDLISELTVKPKVHPDFDTGVESYPIYTEDEKFLYVPRFYGDKTFGKHTSTNIIGKPIDIQFKGKLQEEQVEIVNICQSKILENGGGVISVPCGAGKTVMVLDLICKLGLKALIIVPKSCLLKQTIERIQQFTTARVGIIRQNKIMVDDVDIVVGMIHSIALKDYDDAIFTDFGVVAYDECHRTPSRILSNAFKKAGATYTIGLSATPRRKDGLIRVMFWNIGNIIFKKDKKKDNRVFVHVLNFDSEDKLYVEKKQYINRQYKPSMVRTMTSIIDVENRNKVINEVTVNIIMENVKRQATNTSYRKILVLSERIDHLKTLKKMFDDSVIKLIIQDKINREDAFTSGLYIGGMKQSQLDYSSQADIIYGSYALAKEGLDINDLNVLIMATPQKDIEQAVGRILRKQIQDNDIYPIVVDVCDVLHIFNKWYPEREQFYNKQEYLVENHKVFETNLLTPKNLLLKDKKITLEQFNTIDDEEVRKIYLINRYGEYYYNNLTKEALDKYAITDYQSNKTFENIFDIDYAKFKNIESEENKENNDSNTDTSTETDKEYEDDDECIESNDSKSSQGSKCSKYEIDMNDKEIDMNNEENNTEDYGDIFEMAKKFKEIKKQNKTTK